MPNKIYNTIGSSARGQNMNKLYHVKNQPQFFFRGSVQSIFPHFCEQDITVIIVITVITIMSLKDLLFPKLCLGCGALGSYICNACERKLKIIEDNICVYCRNKSYMGLTHPGCRKTNGIDGIISFYYYNGFLQKIIKHIKYRLATDVFDEFRQIIQPVIQEKLLFCKQILKNGLLQPVPLHSTKLKLRGFNQALLVGNLINTILKMPIVDYFERKKKTLAQAETHKKKDRYQNIQGAFQPKKKTELAGRTVVIVDDVMTTGLTVLELGKAIKRCGASKVFVIALAMG